MFQSLVTQLKNYFEAIRISDNLDEEYIFRAASKNRKCCLRRVNKPISLIRTRQALTDALKAVVLTQRNFESHTLHSGRAIVVANSEVSGRLFERHGSWKSGTTKYGYIDDTLTSLLSVSKQLLRPFMYHYSLTIGYRRKKLN